MEYECIYRVERAAYLHGPALPAPARPAYQYGVLDASPKRAIKKLDTSRGNSVTVDK